MRKSYVREWAIIILVAVLNVVTGYMATGVQAGLGSLFGYNSLEVFRNRWIENFDIVHFMLQGLMVALFGYFVVYKTKRKIAMPKGIGCIANLIAIFFILVITKLLAYILNYLWMVFRISFWGSTNLAHENMVSKNYLLSHMDVFGSVCQAFLMHIAYLIFAVVHENNLRKKKMQEEQKARMKSQRCHRKPAKEYNEPLYNCENEKKKSQKQKEVLLLSE